ncbi:MAG: nitroreductase family protein [Prolixibacteraceae bacterium]|nr:nitroreductase family protein [Prolixibacteraceae bacterium]
MPTIVLDKCIQCMKCVTDCPSGAIDIKTGTIASTCIHCGHCIAICPESTILPDTGVIHPLEASNINSDDFRRFTAELRSHRRYSKKEIPQEIVDALIENMKHYGSASNARPIQITVVKSPEKIQQLNDVSASTLLKSLQLIASPLIAPFIKLFAPSIDLKSLSTYKDSFIQKQKTNKSLICHHAPVVLLFHGPVSKFGMGEADAYIWATNTTLYAKTFGLGSCFIGFIVKAMERNKDLKAAMKIPKNHKVYASLVLGYPKAEYVNETSRESPEVNLV